MRQELQDGVESESYLFEINELAFFFALKCHDVRSVRSFQLRGYSDETRYPRS